MNIYVVYDKVAQESGPIFESKNDGTAIRSFRRLLAEVPKELHEEYQLLCIGSVFRDKNEISVQSEWYIVPESILTEAVNE